MTRSAGVASVFKAVTGQKGALELDEEQRNDAVAKGLAIAYMGYKAYPGSLKERAEAMAMQPAGRSLLQWWVAAEICLPFADNVATAGGQFDGSMLQGGATKQLQRLTALSGGKSLEGAADMLHSLTNTLQKLAEQIARHTKPIVDTVGKYAGGVLSAVDTASGLASTAADVMPVVIASGKFHGGSTTTTPSGM